MGSNSPSLRTLVVIASIATVVTLIVLLKAVLTSVFIAFLLAYMLSPVVDRFEAIGLPRVLSILALLLLACTGSLVFGLLVVPAIARDLSSLLAELPAAARQLLDQGEPILAGLGVELPTSAAEILHGFEGKLGEVGPAAMDSLNAAFKATIGGTVSLLSGLGSAVMVPVFAFYLLTDFDVIVKEVRSLLPARIRSTVVAITHEVDIVLGQFVRGQISVMLILCVLYAVGYSVVGVRLAVPIGIIAGALAFIPYVGGAVALGLALLMVALHDPGVTQLLSVVAVYAVIQALEGFVITPRIVGDKLGLGPVWVLFALMAFAELFGFIGVMLALPVAAALKVLISRGLLEYRRSALYLGSQEKTHVGPESPAEVSDENPPSVTSKTSAVSP